MVYYGQRIQTRISQRKRCIEQSLGTSKHKASIILKDVLPLGINMWQYTWNIANQGGSPKLQCPALLLGLHYVDMIDWLPRSLISVFRSTAWSKAFTQKYVFGLFQVARSHVRLLYMAGPTLTSGVAGFLPKQRPSYQVRHWFPPRAWGQRPDLSLDKSTFFTRQWLSRSFYYAQLFNLWSSFPGKSIKINQQSCYSVTLPFNPWTQTSSLARLMYMTLY